MTTAREFTARLADLLRREHAAMADFLVQLAEFDARKLWRDLGHASLFSFLRRELGLSAGAAQYRKTAAELVQRFAEVEAALRAGRLCLSSVVEVAKVLTRENAAEVLPRFYGLSSRDAAVVAVSIRPVENAPCRDVVTVCRTTAALTSALVAAPGSPEPHPETPLLAFRAPETPANEATCAPAKGTEPVSAPPVARRDVEPLDAEHVRLHLTVSRGFMAKLKATTDALSHARPGASREEVLEASMDLLLAERAKRKGLVERPRKTTVPVASDAVPAAVKREAWLRSGGRCEWRLDGGDACGSTVRLELDHVVPRARGGASTIDNVRVVCRLCRSRHNRHYAESDLMPRASVDALRAWRFGAHDAA